MSGPKCTVASHPSVFGCCNLGSRATRAPVNTPAQFCERSAAAKKTLPETSPLPWIFTLLRLDTDTKPKTKPNQRRTQNQPIHYYDQAPAMNWDHAVSWGRGVLVSVSDIGRVGSGWPTGIETIPLGHSR